MGTVELNADVRKRGFALWLQSEASPDGPTLSRGELQKIVRRAYQRPLGANLANSPQHKLAESPALLDLSKHGFHRLLPQPVATTVPAPAKLVPHRIGACAKLDLALSGGCGLPMFLPPRGETEKRISPQSNSCTNGYNTAVFEISSAFSASPR